MSFRIPQHLRRHLPATSKVSLARQCLAAIFRDSTPYGGYPLSYNVALYLADSRWEPILAAIRKYDLLEPEALNDASFLRRFAEDHDPDRVHEAVIESMQFSLHECDTYRTLRPEIAKQFGVRDDLMVNVRFELQGRQGKHLVVCDFNEHSLKSVDADLLLDETVSDDDLDFFDQDWALQLCAMATEWSQCFSSESIHAEYEYVAATHVVSDLTDAFAPRRRAIEIKRLCRLAKRIRNETHAEARYNW